MGKLLLLAVLAAAVWLWWRSKSRSSARRHISGQDPLFAAADLLRISPDAEPDDIRAAWRRQVAVLRPTGSDDADSLAALTEARDLMLSRATRRQDR